MNQFDIPTYKDLMTAARTVYGEARGESEKGRLAVACVLWNRLRAQRPHYGRKSLSAVCLKPWQFSCWNRNDPNRDKLMKVPAARLEPFIDVVLWADHVAGGPDDPTRKRTGLDWRYPYHYLNPAALKRLPRWARNRQADIVIGNHHFYVGVDD